MIDYLSNNWATAFIPAYRVDRKVEEPHEDVWESPLVMRELKALLFVEEDHWQAATPADCGECGGPLDSELRCGCMSLAGQSNFQLQQEFVRRIGGRVSNTGYQNTPLEWGVKDD